MLVDLEEECRRGWGRCWVVLEMLVVMGRVVVVEVEEGKARGRGKEGGRRDKTYDDESPVFISTQLHRHGHNQTQKEENMNKKISIYTSPSIPRRPPPPPY